MDYNIIIEVVSQVGFPIAVAAFVLVRLNGKMDRLSVSLTKLADAINPLVLFMSETNIRVKQIEDELEDILRDTRAKKTTKRRRTSRS